MRRRHFLAAVPCWVAAGVASAESSDRAGGDPRFPSTIARQVGGKPTKMILTGSALRKKYGFSVYSVASYIQEGARVVDAAGLARADVAKQLHLIFEREVDGPSMAASFRGSIAANHPAPAFGPELAKLERYFVAQGARLGEHLRLTHIPGVGLECQFSGNPGVLIEGVGFARAAWEAYLGPNNLGVAIKEGLTSRLR